MNYLDYILIFILGSMFGSLFNVIVNRAIILKEEPYVKPSHCLFCNEKLKWYHNIPILSFIFLKGKCFFCKKRIPWDYFIFEIITAFTFLIIWHFYRFQIEATILIPIFAIFILIAYIDFKTMTAYDINSFILIFLIAIYQYIFGQDLIVNLIAMAIMTSGIFYLSIIIENIIGKEAIGSGDFMIFGAMGLLLGVEGSITAIAVGCCISAPILIILRIKTLPFIPVLLLGTFIVFLTKFNYVQMLLKGQGFE